VNLLLPDKRLATRIETWDLELLWRLEFGAWSFSHPVIKINQKIPVIVRSFFFLTVQQRIL
jgi:hypothetical protein